MMEQAQIDDVASAMPKAGLPPTTSPRRSLISRLDLSGQFWTHLGAIAFLYAAAIILALRPQWVTGVAPQCAMLAVFHIKCPFCGMTRDFVAILHGQLPTLNPFSWPAVAALYLGYPCVFLLAWKKRRLDLFYRPGVYKVGLAVLVLMCVVNNLQSR
jgi:hypothetical protein